MLHERVSSLRQSLRFDADDEMVAACRLERLDVLLDPANGRERVQLLQHVVHLLRQLRVCSNDSSFQEAPSSFGRQLEKETLEEMGVVADCQMNLRLSARSDGHEVAEGGEVNDLENRIQFSCRPREALRDLPGSDVLVQVRTTRAEEERGFSLKVEFRFEASGGEANYSLMILDESTSYVDLEALACPIVPQPVLSIVHNRAAVCSLPSWSIEHKHPRRGLGLKGEQSYALEDVMGGREVDFCR
mmetsp:Transcript_30786/g.69407  ORF Transcript_30786/g.69407 Transcript_30786/m.69407 type:complete len:245 (+) Transcript_30786:998-1732(+)